MKSNATQTLSHLLQIPTADQGKQEATGSSINTLIMGFTVGSRHYYMLPMLDMWSGVFVVLGSRGSIQLNAGYFQRLWLRNDRTCFHRGGLSALGVDYRNGDFLFDIVQQGSTLGLSILF